LIASTSRKKYQDQSVVDNLKAQISPHLHLRYNLH